MILEVISNLHDSMIPLDLILEKSPFDDPLEFPHLISVSVPCYVLCHATKPCEHQCVLQHCSITSDAGEVLHHL